MESLYSFKFIFGSVFLVFIYFFLRERLKNISENSYTIKDDKKEVENYFNGTGFERWNKIYSESLEVNNVQKNIRIGHNKTIEDVISWVGDTKDLASKTFCDVGCGVGSLSIPLLERGAGFIFASDISKAMVEETKRRSNYLGFNDEKFSVKTADLEELSGSFDTVICLDVFIHYQQEIAEKMVQHLCNLSEDKLIVSFAPYTPFLAFLKSVGQLFPGPSKTTRAYTLKENGIIEAALSKGFRVKRSKLNKAPFYFSKLIEFEKKID